MQIPRMIDKSVVRLTANPQQHPNDGVAATGGRRIFMLSQAEFGREMRSGSYEKMREAGLGFWSIRRIPSAFKLATPKQELKIAFHLVNSGREGLFSILSQEASGVDLRGVSICSWIVEHEPVMQMI